MKRCSPFYTLALLVVICFTLAALLQPRAVGWSDPARSGSVLKMLLGDGRRLFANHFYVQADVAFHSGYYPSIFDQKEKPKEMAVAQTGQAQHDEDAHVREMDYLGRPRDWIEKFGRHFSITEHTHLATGGEREILPWLRISAELDPQRVETYTVAAFWLAKRLNKVDEAEQFLREGLQNNPDSYEILYDLGRIYAELRHDPVRARNLWERALNRWEAREAHKENPDYFALEQIAVHLANLEEQSGDIQRALKHYTLAAKVARHPEALQAQIDALKKKMQSAPR